METTGMIGPNRSAAFVRSMNSKVVQTIRSTIGSLFETLLQIYIVLIFIVCQELNGRFVWAAAETIGLEMGTITKALNLLNFLSSDNPDIGLAEFTRLAGQDKATVYRYLTELQENGFLELDSASKRYRMGPAVLRLANVRETTLPARDAVAPIVKRLSREIGELVHVSMLHGDVLTCLAHADINAHGTRVHFRETDPLPLHATASGIALLAYSEPGLLDHVLAEPLTRFTQYTFTEANQIREAINQTRSTGFSTMDRSYDEEVSSVAVPVFGKRDHPVGAVAVAVPISRMTGQLKKTIRTQLVHGGKEISRALGGAVRQDLEEVWRHAA